MIFPSKETQAVYLGSKNTLPADWNRQARISEMTAVQPGWTYEPALPTVVNDFVPFTGPGDLPVDSNGQLIVPEASKMKIPVWLVLVIAYFIFKKR